MIIVRDIIIAKPGNASKLAAQFKEAAKAGGMKKYRVMTDVTGEMNRVVLEFELDSVSAFEDQMKDYATNEALRAALKGYTEMYETGYRELLQTM
jgi:hypothetical protein